MLYMKMGMSVKEAVEEAMSDLRDLRDPYSAHINLIAVDKAGNYAGMSYRPEKKFAVIRGGEQAATVLDHDDPHPGDPSCPLFTLFRPYLTPSPPSSQFQGAWTRSHIATPKGCNRNRKENCDCDG